MSVYYNEIDEFAVAWLRELIKAKQIPDGEIDTRSITDVRPDDLRGFRQCHFFAGIGGWAYALRLAGWPDDRDVWTGSCPCQPFSMAGKGEGADDPRHLWPAWFPLIRERRPHTVFGEQVASKDGEYWFDLVHADMEGIDYALGPVDLPAAGVGAPNRRQRFWFVADAEHDGRGRVEAPRLHERRQGARGDEPPAGETHGARRDDALRRGADDDMEHAEGERCQRGASGRRQARRRPEHAGWMGDTEREGSQGLSGHGDDWNKPGWFGAVPARSTTAAGATHGFWFPCDWLPCSDGKTRPVEPGTFPLADGIPARVGRLRGYGNAINPWVAKEVIAAYMDVRGIDAAHK